MALAFHRLRIALLLVPERKASLLHCAYNNCDARPLAVLTAVLRLREQAAASP
jgi:hypothetical protein